MTRDWRVTLLHQWRCHVCELPVSARSEAALQAAMDAHTAHVNAHLPQATDEHFAESRLDRLLAV